MKPASVAVEPKLPVRLSPYGQGTRPRILAVCALDVMAWKLLRPWFRALLEAGYEVHIACARTNWFEQLAADGFHMHDVPLRRRMNPLVHIAPLWALYQLIRRERFVLGNTRSPAGVAGRSAAVHSRRSPHCWVENLRTKLNIPQAAPVVGIVARLVREKGYIEF